MTGRQGLGALFGRLAPPLAKSWIRHCSPILSLFVRSAPAAWASQAAAAETNHGQSDRFLSGYMNRTQLGSGGRRHHIPGLSDELCSTVDCDRGSGFAGPVCQHALCSGKCSLWYCHESRLTRSRARHGTTRRGTRTVFARTDIQLRVTEDRGQIRAQTRRPDSSRFTSATAQGYRYGTQAIELPSSRVTACRYVQRTAGTHELHAKPSRVQTQSRAQEVTTHVSRNRTEIMLHVLRTI